jgi:tRNA nucleotidyltransferase (CCA-adding enzyme)
MNIYLVGGAVRDQLLQRPVKERDWVVVGSTPDALLAQGFVQVGKDFPVFLHPKTKEEYALARTERKVSKGYTGFECEFSPNVTLKEDLLRRDLTINAIAQDEQQQLIDPYDGQKDIERKVLRHISPAFSEDPVRLLRLARFAARFPEFSVADETCVLMKQMVEAGEVDALVPERVWKEFEKALGEQAPVRFLEVLHDSGALAVLFPALEKNYQQCRAYLHAATEKTPLVLARFAVLAQAVDGVAALEKLCQDYRLPNQFARMATLVKKYEDRYMDISHASPENVLDTIKLLDGHRRPERFEQWLGLCKITASIIHVNDTQDYENYSQTYMACLAQLQQQVISKQEVTQHEGPEIAEFINQKRLSLLKSYLPSIQKNLH